MSVRLDCRGCVFAWFLCCAHVKAQVRERLEVEPELADVIAVCEAWEDGLEVS